EQLAGRRHAAADRDHVGLERVDHVGDPDAEAFAEDAQALQARGVAALGRLDGGPAVDEAALGGQLIQGAPGGQALQRPRLRRAPWGSPPRAAPRARPGPRPRWGACVRGRAARPPARRPPPWSRRRPRRPAWSRGQSLILVRVEWWTTPSSCSGCGSATSARL